MRILLLTQLFNPEPNHLKGLTFAKELVGLGHEVQVLTGFPCYPGGKVYDGYKLRLCQRENMDGIEVIRLPMYPSHDSSGLKRMANYGSLALILAIAGPLLTKRPDIVHVYQGPATLSLPAWAFRYLRGVPFVYDIQDLWPDSLAESGMFSNRTGISIVEKWCRATYRSASRVIVLSDGFKRELCHRGVPGDKVDVVYNWCEDTAISRDEADSHLLSDYSMSGKFNVVLAGTMGKMQGLDAVIDAAALLQSVQPCIQLLFIGAGVELANLREKASRLELPNVQFVPRQPITKIGHFLALADALLIHLRDSPLMRITIPQKVQAYMAAGRPIIIGTGGESDELVRRAGAGITCRPEDPHSIADAVLRMFSLSEEKRSEMGRHGRRFYESELAIAVGVKKMDRVFRCAVSGKTSKSVSDDGSSSL